MAIQFNCPFCTSQIRVPDSAGGKRGSCPRCKSKILVPKVKAAAAAAAETPEATQPAPPKSRKKSLTERFAHEPDFSQFAASSADGDTPVAAADPVAATVPVAEEPAPAEPPPVPRPLAPPAAPTSYSQALKRRRRKRWTTWVPVIFGLLLVIGVGVFFLISGNVKLEGTLEASPLEGASLEPRTINTGIIPATEEQVKAVLKHLQDNPLPLLRSDRGLMEHEISTSAGGFSVRVNETPQMQFFRIDLRQNKPLQNYLKEHAKELDKPRTDELDAGLKQFFELASASVKADGGVTTEMLEILRRRVVINSLVGPAGYNLVATVRGQSFLCMYEDDDGRLYFLLPRGTKEFTLKGRKLSDGTKLFPGSYTVEVGAAVSENALTKPAEKTEPQKTESEKAAAKTESKTAKTE